MEIFQTEVALSVPEYGGDFYKASSDTEGARKEFVRLAEGCGVEYTIVGVTFLEFDSNNPTHAGAYFEVQYESESEINLYGEE